MEAQCSGTDLGHQTSGSNSSGPELTRRPIQLNLVDLCRAAAVGLLALGSKAALLVKSAGGGKAALALLAAGELYHSPYEEIFSLLVWNTRPEQQACHSSDSMDDTGCAWSLLRVAQFLPQYTASC